MERRSFFKLAFLSSIPVLSFGKINLLNLNNLEEINLKKDVADDFISNDEALLGSFLGIDMYSRRAKLSSKDTRRLHLYNPHTKETFKHVYYSNGIYKKKVLSKLNYFMRDFREKKTKRIDVELVDLMYSLQKSTSADKPLNVLSGYRTKKTNRKVRGAKHSQHMAGKAVDLSPKHNTRHKLARMKKQAKNKAIGGVGYYRRKGFVHVDTGPVRYWG